MKFDKQRPDEETRQSIFSNIVKRPIPTIAEKPLLFSYLLDYGYLIYDPNEKSLVWSKPQLKMLTLEELEVLNAKLAIL